MKRANRKLFKMNPAIPDPEEMTPMEFFLSHSPSEQRRLMELFIDVVDKGERDVLHTLDLGTIRCAA